MEYNRTFLLNCSLLLALQLLTVAAFAESPAATVPTATIQLFNGKDLTSFYTWLQDRGPEDPLGVFTIVDQVDGGPAIRISGQEWGGLVTRDSFSRYHLVVEFRWGLITWGERRNATRDSGILVHCQGPDGNTRHDRKGPWMRSIEAQIIQGGVGDFILVGGYDDSGNLATPQLTVRSSRDRDGEPVYDPDGGEEIFERGRINWYARDPDWEDRLDFRGKRDVESPVTEWTRLEVIVEDERITNIVNGRVVNQAARPSLTSGRILLQSEGAEIFFRKVELRPLPDKEADRADSKR